ncbi:MAG: hypothetical protein U0R50_02800 [Gaiellales bacterium]
MTSALSIDERLARLEAAEREMWDLRHSLAERLDAVRRGAGIFDAPTRERVRRLRELEAALGAERIEVDRLVGAACEAVLARRAEERSRRHRAATAAVFDR